VHNKREKTINDELIWKKENTEGKREFIRIVLDDMNAQANSYLGHETRTMFDKIDRNQVLNEFTDKSERTCWWA
jgi:hypothetical protein